MPKSNHKSIKKPRKIYLDYASSAQPNPSSIHKSGVEAKISLQNARRIVANILGSRLEEVIFTSGGTESNNLAILGTALPQIFSSYNHPTGSSLGAKKFKQTPPHIITTNIEHPSVLETCKILEKRGLVRLSIIPVETNGIVDPLKIKKELNKNTVLVSVVYANNEIGTIQPVKEIAKAVRQFKKLQKVSIYPLFHVDAVQGSNYLDLNVEKLGVDLLSLSGSKIENGGKVGVLFKKKLVPLSPILHGGSQEWGIRPGTENLEEIIKFSKALKEAQKIKEKEKVRLAKLRDYFAMNLRQTFPSLIFNGDLVNRLPNNLNITIKNIPSDLLVIELSEKGIMASSKSACKEGDGKVSHVIKAINKNIKDTDGSLRFSFGRKTKKSDLDFTLKKLKDILKKLKKWYT
ncbi:cysteine desulfurase [Candidatus Nomurabacteria bacterium]|nr:cysteine desulfurase [Candidatus Nomurabacteria bacterium]